jgi:Mg-chelatase subunit ChlI
MVTENLKKFIHQFFHLQQLSRMKLALQLNVIDPKIGGVMIMEIDEELENQR